MPTKQKGSCKTIQQLNLYVSVKNKIMNFSLEKLSLKKNLIKLSKLNKLKPIDHKTAINSHIL